MPSRVCLEKQQQHHAVHANTLLSQAPLSHENVRKMTRRPGPIQFNLCNQQFANIWGWGAHLWEWSRVQPSQQKTVRLFFFFSSRVVCKEDFAFKTPKPVRQSWTTFVVPCQVLRWSATLLAWAFPRGTGAAGSWRLFRRRIARIGHYLLHRLPLRRGLGVLCHFVNSTTSALWNMIIAEGYNME